MSGRESSGFEFARLLRNYEHTDMCIYRRLLAQLVSSGPVAEPGTLYETDLAEAKALIERNPWPTPLYAYEPVGVADGMRAEIAERMRS